MPGGLGGEYSLASIDGRLVTGIGQAQPSSPAVWASYVRVEDVERSVATAKSAGGTRLVGLVDAGSDGRLAILTDATGVPFGLWQAGSRPGAQLVGEPGTWAVCSLHTTDLGRAEEFYRLMFGWELDHETGSAFCQWRLAGGVVAVASAIGDQAVPPHLAVNFAVDDADATAERAGALGGSVLVAPTDTPGFRSAVIADPQRGVIAVTATRG